MSASAKRLPVTPLLPMADAVASLILRYRRAREDRGCLEESVGLRVRYDRRLAAATLARPSEASIVKQHGVFTCQTTSRKHNSVLATGTPRCMIPLASFLLQSMQKRIVICTLRKRQVRLMGHHCPIVIAWNRHRHRKKEVDFQSTKMPSDTAFRVVNLLWLQLGP